MAQDSTKRRDRPAFSTPKREAEDWLGFMLSHSAAIVARHTAEALHPFGLTPRSLGFLVQLRALGSASQLDVARAVRMDRTTSSQLVEELTARSLIARDIDPRDRRHNKLSLTAQGETLLSAAEREASNVESVLLTGLSTAERASLHRALQRFLTIDGQD